MIIKDASSSNGYCFISECGASYYVVVIGSKTHGPFKTLANALEVFDRYCT